MALKNYRHHEDALSSHSCAAANFSKKLYLSGSGYFFFFGAITMTI